jgi:5-methylcytosine-specific restriction protein A
MAQRNPPWTRDELILALDLYLRHHPSHISNAHPEVKKLSEVLNALPIHTDRPDSQRFRNENGVYTKLCNFLRFDPSYQGKGLTHGNSGEEAVWKEFADDPKHLAQIAAAIRKRVAVGERKAPDRNGSAIQPDEDEFPEGRVLFREHRARERSRALVQAAKSRFLKAHGKLACQICGFAFSDRYGELGEGYIECHHVVAVSELEPNSKTKLSDIALLCSNCHRMIHRRRPWLSMEELKSLVER